LYTVVDQVTSALPELTAKRDTVGVFVPSVLASILDSHLDAACITKLQELAASISQYPQAVIAMATSVSNFGLLLLYHHLH